MSIDFSKFKKNIKKEQEIVEEKLADIESDNEEMSDRSDNMNNGLSDNLEESDKSFEKRSDKSDFPPKYTITSDHLRAIYVMITGKTNRGYSKQILK